MGGSFSRSLSEEFAPSIFSRPSSSARLHNEICADGGSLCPTASGGSHPPPSGRRWAVHAQRCRKVRRMQRPHERRRNTRSFCFEPPSGGSKAAAIESRNGPASCLRLRLKLQPNLLWRHVGGGARVRGVYMDQIGNTYMSRDEDWFLYQWRFVGEQRVRMWGHWDQLADRRCPQSSVPNLLSSMSSVLSSQSLALRSESSVQQNLQQDRSVVEIVTCFCMKTISKTAKKITDQKEEYKKLPGEETKISHNLDNIWMCYFHFLSF